MLLLKAYSYNSNEVCCREIKDYEITKDETKGIASVLAGDGEEWKQYHTGDYQRIIVENAEGRTLENIAINIIGELTDTPEGAFRMRGSFYENYSLDKDHIERLVKKYYIK